MRLGRINEARTAYQAELALTSNAVERKFLIQRLRQLESETA
jgi:predicted RNA polymerase sigma factor